MQRMNMPVALLAAAAAILPPRADGQNNQVVPETKTIKNTRIEMGEEKPGIIKIGETKAVKIGEGRAMKIGEPPSERFKKIGLDVDLRAMHEATFGPIGQNDWATSAVPAAAAAAQPDGSTNAPPAGAGDAKLPGPQPGTSTNAPAVPQVAKPAPTKPAPRRGGIAGKICVVTGLPCSELCPGQQP